MSVALWVNGVRPRTLPASVAPVVVGAAAGWERLQTTASSAMVQPSSGAGGGTVNQAASAASVTTMESRFWPVAVLCALVALFLQIAVNFANDYSDGIRGTDEGRGRQSGNAPTRLVASGVPATRVLAAAGVAAALACVCGLAVIAVTGHWWMLAVGACCLLAGWFYTGGKHPYGYAGLGELAVFVFFGLVAVLGTQYMVCGGVDAAGVFGAVYSGALSCVLLMVNNLRDYDDDRLHGKRTLAVRMGRPVAQWFAMFVYCVAALSPAAIAIGRLVLALVHWTGILCISTGALSSCAGGASGGGVDGVVTLADADSGTVCAPIPPSAEEWIAGVLGVALLAVAIRMIRALLRRDYGVALGAAGITLVVYALIFVSLMPSTMDSIITWLGLPM